MLLFFGLGQQGAAQTFTIVYSFNSNDGWGPWGLAVDASGNLYGTIDEGGPARRGVVFKIDPSGNETILHNFTGGTDGMLPLAGVVLDSAGNIYGTTEQGGGSAGHGIVFKIDPAGNETILHSFTGGTDGLNPHAGVILDASGNLYGTTSQGGSAGLGTVFKIDVSGVETILHTFAGGTDGEIPEAGLVRDASGNLYGTTSGGGGSGCGFGCGTAFRIDAAGNETILHSFTGGTDGAFPMANLIMDASGNLFGTTNIGGGSACYGSGCGTVFKIDQSGNETMIHSFTGGSDGSFPAAGLAIDASGNLYGTTNAGGSANLGVVFKVDASGNETLVHSFSGGTDDGEWPRAGLVLDSSGNLYGTTSGGGVSDFGTVFKVSLSVPFSSFDAKLDIAAGGFQLQSFFTQGTGASAVDPVTQGMTLTIGTYTVTIPPGAFLQTKKGWFVYEGMIDGVALQVRISQTGANSYELQAEGSGPSFNSLTKPLTVALTLGNNNGATVVNQ